MEKKLEIKITNGIFESVEGTVKIFSPTQIVGMGWFVKVYNDGSINAICKEVNKLGTTEIRVKLTNDTFTIIKKHEEKNAKVEMKEKISSKDGVLTLSCDEKKRRVYFDEKEKIELKKDYLLNSIVKCSPNRMYREHVSAIAHTNGNFFKTITGKSECVVTITDATWVIIETPVGETTRHLYTSESLADLKLPKILSFSKRKEALNSLKKEFKDVGEATEYFESLNLYKHEWYDLESFDSDHEYAEAEYYLNGAGILTVYLTRISIWDSKESFVKSGDIDLVIERKGKFYKYERVLEAKGYGDYTSMPLFEVMAKYI